MLWADRIRPANVEKLQRLERFFIFVIFITRPRLGGIRTVAVACRKQFHFRT